MVLVVALAGSALAGWLGGEPQPAPAGGEPLPPPGERVRVEVLNGAGISGLARDVTRELRDAGFDVVFFGNAPGGRRDTTIVVDRVGDPRHAHRVAGALGVGVVRSEPDTTLYLEATVILGRDWEALRGGAGGEPGTGTVSAP